MKKDWIMIKKGHTEICQPIRILERKLQLLVLKVEYCNTRLISLSSCGPCGPHMQGVPSKGLNVLLRSSKVF